MLLTTVEYVKANSAKTFVITDAAMNDLIRPALYDGQHEIVPLVECMQEGACVLSSCRPVDLSDSPSPGGETEGRKDARTEASSFLSPVDVVGPICESSDFLAKSRPMPPVAAGDRLAVMSAGAYGASMSSTYNSRPLLPEVLVEGDHWHIIRRRQTFDEMVGLEI